MLNLTLTVSTTFKSPRSLHLSIATGLPLGRPQSLECAAGDSSLHVLEQPSADAKSVLLVTVLRKARPSQHNPHRL
jgi:hypothetical protein